MWIALNHQDFSEVWWLLKTILITAVNKMKKILIEWIFSLGRDKVGMILTYLPDNGVSQIHNATPQN